jgi:hypothetical protein
MPLIQTKTPIVHPQFGQRMPPFTRLQGSFAGVHPRLCVHGFARLDPIAHPHRGRSECNRAYTDLRRIVVSVSFRIGGSPDRDFARRWPTTDCKLAWRSEAPFSPLPAFPACNADPTHCGRACMRRQERGAGGEGNAARVVKLHPSPGGEAPPPSPQRGRSGE